MSNQVNHAEKTLHQMAERFDKLKQSAMEVNADIKSAGERLEILKQKAKEMFDTDDLDELVTLLEDMEEEEAKEKSDCAAKMDEKQSEIMMKTKALKEIKG